MSTISSANDEPKLSANDDSKTTANNNSTHSTIEHPDNCLHLDVPYGEDEIVGALTLRRGSCATQWDLIKERFTTWRENGPKNIVKLTVQHDIGIAHQIDASAQHLTGLEADGTELIRNVLVANDVRELARRTSNTADRDALDAAVRSDAAATAVQLATTIDGWSQLDRFREPCGLHAALLAQKQRIASLMAQKDALIRQLNDAVLAADRQYQAALQTQTGDIGTLIDRIDTQVDVMRAEYSDHLEILQRTLDAERMQFGRAEAQRWHSLYERRDSVELDGMLATATDCDRFDRQLFALIGQHEEQNRGTRIRLERDAAALQIELQTVKADVLLNSAKLSYNHHVLLHRAEENATVKAQQKARLMRLQQVVAALRDRYADAVRLGSAEVRRMSAQVTKLYASVREADAKARTFGAIGARKYADVWTVHELEMMDLLRQFGQIDGRIAERLLCSRPERMFTVHAAASVAGGLQSRRRPHTTAGLLRSTQPVDDVSDGGRLIEVILNKIATHTEWLQDGDFDVVLDDERLGAAAKRLIRIDHVLNALGLANDVGNLHALMCHFVPHVFCERCDLRPGQKAVEEPSKTATMCSGRHSYVIDETLVVPTLRSFVEGFYRRYSEAVTVSSDIRGTEMDAQDVWTVRRNQPKVVAEYWKSYVAKVPAHYGNLWTALESGLSKYLQILKKRQKLDGECEFLRRQNAELNNLLMRYVPPSNLISD